MIAKVTMKALCSFIIALLCGVGSLSAAQQWKDTIVVARDGTGDYRTLTEAMEGIRAFMDYKVTVLVKKGVYKEKVILPSWLENVDFIGENVENTIITYDDHANINKMGTFRTYTLKVEGSSITFKNLTIENNAARLGQAVALHTEGDRLVFINCRFLGNQDTIYTGAKGTRLCWRPYAATVFINCEMGKHICPAGWDNWRNPENEKTARYAEYGNTGEGADNTNRVKWVKQLTRKDVAKYEEPDYLFKICSEWKP